MKRPTPTTLADFQREFAKILAAARERYKPEGISEDYFVECLARTAWQAAHVQHLTTQWLNYPDASQRRATALRKFVKLLRTLDRNQNWALQQLIAAQKERHRNGKQTQPVVDVEYFYVQ